MNKYEKEHATFTKLKAHYEQEKAGYYLWSEIFMGWETKRLKDMLVRCMACADAVINELDNLLTMIEKRRAE